MSQEDSRRTGFTIIEILVVVIIIAILAGLAAVQYFKTIEAHRADQGLAVAQQIAAANHMFSLDNINDVTGSRIYPFGQINDTCNSGACGNGSSPCDLVRCTYLARRSWSSLPYNIYALNPSDTFADSNCGFTSSGISGTGYTACVSHKTGVSAPYVNWGYVVDTTGRIQAVNGAPSPL